MVLEPAPHAGFPSSGRAVPLTGRLVRDAPNERYWIERGRDFQLHGFSGETARGLPVEGVLLHVSDIAVSKCSQSKIHMHSHIRSACYFWMFFFTPGTVNRRMQIPLSKRPE